MGKKELVGVVVSTYMKTAVVKVERITHHPLYLKQMKTFTKYYAHDENNQAKVGDVVKIRQTRPLSKLKRWRIVEILGGGE
ncbi:30S ribosomal protein S17 [Caldisericum exile]|uniref:Small ribosomal subunit protein uS17 n=1 Tax=Caldisericum exile (strain DSM 21853 / NBRC 104410 / AZM16c01) TaxID=511051 RepID=A0A7U6JFA1_CALEA|nr:30S ribosomal protein S17 [Caldisericum exile]BAL81258.1 30S ribosomal protein S17 [Caldisericum exile AZM16c01]